MAGLLDETVLSFSELARGSRGPAGRVNPSTVFRWAKKGVTAPDGTQVRLESIRIGGRLFTSREAYGRFLGNLATADEGDDTTPLTRTPSERRKASEKAAKELERMGA